MGESVQEKQGPAGSSQSSTEPSLAGSPSDCRHSALRSSNHFCREANKQRGTEGGVREGAAPQLHSSGSGC